MRSLWDCRLYSFVDTAYLGNRSASEVARQLCEGGSDLIQLRAKSLAYSEIFDLAMAILPITNKAGVGLVINDYPDIARRLGAFACHLGQEDFFDGGHSRPEQVTGCPSKFRLGLSTHAPKQALRALNAQPDYVAIGPVYATGTKPTATPVTLDYVRWAADNVKIPWFAIGGINLENVDAVLAAGATRICVVSAILDSSDVAGACRAFKRRLA